MKVIATNPELLSDHVTSPANHIEVVESQIMEVDKDDDVVTNENERSDHVTTTANQKASFIHSHSAVSVIYGLDSVIDRTCKDGHHKLPVKLKKLIPKAVAYCQNMVDKASSNVSLLVFIDINFCLCRHIFSFFKYKASGFMVFNALYFNCYLF